MTAKIENEDNVSPKSSNEKEHFPVLIVGAGPIGMSMGLALARYGIRSLILDDDDKLSEGSRAICIQRHTLQIFERQNVVKPMMDKGVTWTKGRVFFGDKELYQITFPGGSDEKYPPFINLGQNDVEQFLLEGVKAQQLCEIRWRHKVVALSQSGDGVTLSAETPDGPKTFQADYVLACDGARSPVRHMLKVEFVGKTYHDFFLIVDVRTKLDQPNERWFWFDPVFNRGRSTLIHPQPDSVYRIDWQLGSAIDQQEVLKPEYLDRRIKEVIGQRPYEIVWASVYTFHQRHAEKFKVGRVFLLGDAAHLMSPFGARGMNSGIQDVNNLAWKLWLVMNGRAASSLLETYETERKAAAVENLRITDGTMAFITPHSKPRLLLRNTILRGSVRLKRLRKRVNSGRLSTPFTYTHSSLVSPDLHLPEPRRLASNPALLKAAWAFRRGPLCGALAPDARYTFKNEDNPPERRRLIDLFGQEFVALYFSDQTQPAAQELEQVLKSSLDLPVRGYVVSKQLAALSETSSVTTLWDETSEVARAYAAQPGTLYLIRPDGHIAARGFEFPLADLGKILEKAINGQSLAVRNVRY